MMFDVAFIMLCSEPPRVIGLVVMVQFEVRTSFSAHLQISHSHPVATAMTYLTDHEQETTGFSRVESQF
jgi:hypothetical protein